MKELTRRGGSVIKRKTLKEQIDKYGVVETAKIYGVSHSLIISWRDRLGIERVCPICKQRLDGRGKYHAECQPVKKAQIRDCVCEFCGKEFQTYVYNQRFCTRVCKHRGKNRENYENGRHPYLMAKIRARRFSDEKLKRLITRNELVLKAKREGANILTTRWKAIRLTDGGLLPRNEVSARAIIRGYKEVLESR